MAKLIPLKSYEEKVTAVEIRFGELQGAAASSFISWERLQALLKRTHEIRVKDKFNKVNVDENGIQYYLE